MTRHYSIPALLIALALLAAGCTKSLPDDEGVYIRQGETWAELQPVPLDEIRKPATAKLEVLEKVPTASEPRVLLAELDTKNIQVYARSKSGAFEPVTAGATPTKDDEDVYEMKFPKALPQGLVIVQTGENTAVAFVNGADAAFYHRLGMARKAEGQDDSAIEALKQALEADPAAGDVLNDLARIKAAAKEDLSEAMALINRAIESAKSGAAKAKYYDTLAEIYYVMGEPKKAIEAVDRAIALDPKNDDFQQHLVKMVAKAEKASPDKVLKEFYEHLSDKDFDDAADLADPFDVNRLKDAEKLDERMEKLAKGAPFQDIVITKTEKRGKAADIEYAVISSDGARRTESIQLQYDDGNWRVSLQ